MYGSCKVILGLHTDIEGGLKKELMENQTANAMGNKVKNALTGFRVS